MTTDLHIPEFIAPRYGGGCFSDIPGFIRSVLVGDEPSALHPDGFDRLPQRYESVVLLFVDAFGWRFFEQSADRYPFLQRFVRHGSATKLTSQFPSTTSAHVTALYTGKPVGQHGVFEWQYYEPIVDALIQPLPFTFAGDKQPEKLREGGVTGAALLPRNDFVQGLQAAGVSCYVSQPGMLSGSTYSTMISEGATLLPYKTQPEMLVNLSLAMDEAKGPALFSLYLSQVDSICHDYGPGSLHVEAEIEACFTGLESWFRREQARGRRDTLLMVIADHGQVDVDPDTVVYINTTPEYAQLKPLLRTNRQGQVLAPAGSARDMFLYIREGEIDAAQALLEKIVGDRAVVLRTADLIADGYFGPPPFAPQLPARVGDLVILPLEGESVWWYEKDRFDMKFHGHHGGLTPNEMEIPLLLYAFE
ncbi:MAG: alkaline phosphatase family protein [Caldilineae bacterium]|nr:alkaline phosphatase family protein [Caldilineae bacterium]